MKDTRSRLHFVLRNTFLHILLVGIVKGKELQILQGLTKIVKTYVMTLVHVGLRPLQILRECVQPCGKYSCPMEVTLQWRDKRAEVHFVHRVRQQHYFT